MLISSTILFMRNSPHPRGVCMPSSFASRSGVSPPWDGGGPLPLSVIRTMRSPSSTRTTTSTGTSALYLLPCSMAFIVASSTAVLSRSRFSPRMSRSLIASATVSIANLSFPGSLGTENLAMVRRSSASVRAVRPDQPLQAREAEHIPLRVVGLDQAVAVEQHGISPLQHYLLLLVTHPRQQPERHPRRPELLRAATTGSPAPVGQVVAGVGIAQKTCPGIEDGVEAGD